MASNQPGKPSPSSHQPAKPPAKRVDGDERTVELTDAEIKSFGRGGAPAVRAGSKRTGNNPPKSK